jgi:acetylglutamate kinase
MLSIALGAEKMILITITRGVLRDPSVESTLIRSFGTGTFRDLGRTASHGGMIPKIECCATPVEAAQ